jgi:hypothetical protein
MNKESEKLVTWGLLALIAWELWPTHSGTQVVDTTSDDIRPWMKQLSQNTNVIDFFSRPCGGWR